MCKPCILVKVGQGISTQPQYVTLCFDAGFRFLVLSHSIIDNEYPALINHITYIHTRHDNSTVTCPIRHTRTDNLPSNNDIVCHIYIYM